MNRDQIITGVDAVIRCSAAVSVALFACIAGVFGLISLAAARDIATALPVLLILVGGAVVVLGFMLLAIFADRCAQRVPGPTRAWSIALRVIVYPVGIAGGILLVRQIIQVNF